MVEKLSVRYGRLTHVDCNEDSCLVRIRKFKNDQLVGQVCKTLEGTLPIEELKWG